MKKEPDHPDNTDQSPFWLEDWHVEPAAGRLKRLNEVVKLEPKVMMVLVCLARQAGQVVSREALEAAVWTNTIVGYDALASTIIKLRKALGDDPKNPKFVETVPKKGYRLIVPIRDEQNSKEPFAPEPHNSNSKANSEKGQPGSFKKLILINSVILIVMLFILYKQFSPLDSGVAGDTNGLPSVAVLPFKNISDDPSQEYFSDGITSDLITDLSKVSGLLVIARNSSFTYKNTQLDVQAIGKELGVSYIIEGSVRKINNKIRISAQLINVANGYNLWADRVDGDLKNIFTFQDQFLSKIITALQVKITDTESKQIAKTYTDSIEAYDLFLRGYQHFWEFSKDGNNSAKDYFEKAIKKDKEFARAYGNLALTHTYAVLNGWSENFKDSKDKAMYFARRGIELDDSLSNIHWAMAVTAVVNRDYKLALEASQKSIELGPNSADGYGVLATTLNYAAKPKEALTNMKKAMRLNPHYPFGYVAILGQINFNLHNYPEAIKNFEEVLRRNPEVQETKLWLAATYAHVGKIDDAKWEIEQIRIVDPTLSIERVEKVIPLKDPGQLKHLINGLQKAGLN